MRPKTKETEPFSALGCALTWFVVLTAAVVIGVQCLRWLGVDIPASP